MKQYVIVHTQDKLSYIDMKSVTKFFVGYAIAYLVHKKKMRYDDKLVKFIPKYQYDYITILDILQHTSGLENSWSTFIGDDYTMSDLYVQYNKSKNPYEFVLSIKRVYQHGQFHYNNYAYDILCLIVQKITHMTIKEFLAKILFTPLDIRFDWYTVKNQYRGGYGLCITATDIHKLVGMPTLMRKINYEHKQTYENIVIGEKTFIGHSGSGGQFLYFSEDLSEVYLVISGNNPDDIPKED